MVTQGYCNDHRFIGHGSSPGEHFLVKEDQAGSTPVRGAIYGLLEGIGIPDLLKMSCFSVRVRGGLPYCMIPNYVGSIVLHHIHWCQELIISLLHDGFGQRIRYGSGLVGFAVCAGCAFVDGVALDNTS